MQRQLLDPAALPQSASGETKESNASQPANPTSIDQPLTTVPIDLFENEVGSLLGVSDAKNTIRALHAPETKKWASSLFSNPAIWQKLKENENEHRLFQHLIRGEQAEVKTILDEAKRKNPRELLKLLTTKHSIIDHAGRYFEDITLFQLALWNLDRHMWRMLLVFFKDETMAENSDPARKDIHRELRQAAYDQYREHRSGKLPYTQENGEYYQFAGKEPGKEGLVTELRAYRDLVAGREFSWADKAQTDKAFGQWQRGVGGAQARAPLHVIQEYCREDGPGFRDPLPATRFKEEQLPRTVRFDDCMTGAGMLVTFWMALTSGLGRTFGIYRGFGWRAGAVSTRIGGCRLDLTACSRLCQVRMEEYQALEPELQKNLKAVVDSSAEAVASVVPSLSLRH